MSIHRACLSDGVAKLGTRVSFEPKPVDGLELKPVLWDLPKLHQFHAPAGSAT